MLMKTDSVFVSLYPKLSGNVRYFSNVDRIVKNDFSVKVTIFVKTARSNVHGGTDGVREKTSDLIQIWRRKITEWC